MKCDKNGRDMHNMIYARVMVEVIIGREFHLSISFQDEIGKMQLCKIEYDWIPIVCQKCNCIGHSSDVCRKGQPKVATKKVWRSKVIQNHLPPVVQQSVPPEVVSSIMKPIQ